MKSGRVKILQMPVRNAKGGITQYALRNWEHIDKSRFVFDWVTLDKELSFESQLIRQGCKVYHLSCRQEEDETRFRAEMRAILADGYDAVHLHTSFWRGFLAEELALEAGVPRIIVHAHSTGIDVADNSARERLLRAHEKWKSRFSTELATHFAACSEPAARFLFGPRIPKERVVILKNAIDIEQFAFDKAMRVKMRAELNLDGKFVIMQAARLVYQKNHKFSLKVFSEIRKAIPNAAFLLAGDGELREELERQACGNVRFLGFRRDVPQLFQAADLLIIPSLFEGLTIAAVEAQCSGIRCLFSDNVARETILADNAYCLPLDVERWCNEIISAANNCYERLDRSEEVAAAGYSLKEQIKVVEKLYAGE